MKKYVILLVVLSTNIYFTFCQSIDTMKYRIKAESSLPNDQFFTRDPVWRGADGASSIDLGNGKILWLFSDTFIDAKATGSRENATMVRNSVGVQEGNDLNGKTPNYFWGRTGDQPDSFFKVSGDFWFWTGHGARIKDKLIVFLMKIKSVKTGLGFEAFGWYVVLISNPDEEPSKWNMQYFEGPDTFGTMAGSAAVLKDQHYIYAFGAVEPATHEVYLLRWKIEKAYQGEMANPDWYINGKWQARNAREQVPAPLFVGGSEYSVHYDTLLKKYIQIQSFGFGEGKIGLRMADSIQGKWSEPYLFYTPSYTGVKRPFMYAAKAHPELRGNGIYITYNVNSFDFGELVKNQKLYFPKFILLKVEEKEVPRVR